jgi:ribosome assembly protein YihI (activator of Der GTPase)
MAPLFLYGYCAMARKTKSRKIGLIGVRKSPDFKRVEKEKRAKKALGKPAGNRNSLIASKEANNSKIVKDPRLGSKKPVELFVALDENKNSPRKIINKPLIKHAAPEAELAQIEGDERLTELLGKADSDLSLDKKDQLYVSEKLARHKELCELLGISDELKDSSSTDEDDLYEMFESIDVNKLNNF